MYPGRLAAGRSGPGRPAAGRQGLLCKIFAQIIARRSIGPVARPPGRPAAGRPALPPLYKGWLVPPLLIYITTIPETKKKEKGRERGETLPDFRAGDCR